MVGSENINRLVELPDLKLIVMIGNIRNNIGRNAVRPYENEILVAAEVGGSEPERSLKLIGMTALFERLDYS